jgi:hypothetical protein
MKRLLYGVTIACVGVLTAVAVRTPATQEVSLSGGASVPHAVQYVIDSRTSLDVPCLRIPTILTPMT